ncbi:FAST kinase domain-containing protein 1, mitochondrial [Lampris incognitus]|uniref:FAST kinase domain-containing protein 1, mitochondrial n=1 Tax=Lampris incognitus TaxID=2546036 RepID=UPI0024B62396|nr:FAST kinase domain-containing protein 1, mitochondrial [Lampris incognitus]
MFRLRPVASSLRRSLRVGAASRDQVLEQLQVCSGEEQVFELVGKNKAKLTARHVGCATGMLWQFQKERPQMLRTVEHVKNHPEFMTLRVLAENKISLMDDCMLVDVLYEVLRLSVEPHDSLVQQLISEAWLRSDRLPLTSLSKFAICLHDQNLHHSPLMGHITNILAQKLSSIDDVRILSALMISVSSLVSPRLRDALISKVDQLLDTMDPAKYNNARRVVQFLRNIKCHHRPLLEKCNQIILQSVPNLDAEHIGIIAGLYQSLQFNNCDFRLAVKHRLIELIELSTDPSSFTKVFVVLGPMANAEIRERLENTALLLAEELSAQQALAIVEALEEIQCRNLNLINKIASVTQKYLYVYKAMDVARIAQALFLLRYQNPEHFTKLKSILMKFLMNSVFPYEVTMLTRVLSMLPCPQLHNDMISRVDAVLTQCSLNDLNTFALSIAKWIRNDPSKSHNAPSKYVRLLQTLNRCGHERLHTADRLDLVLEELKFVSGEWFEEMLLEECMLTLQRTMDQITWANVHDVSLLLTRANHLCTPLMDRIAHVTVKDIDKIYFSATYATLLPFAILNYDPPSADDFFEVCIQRFTPHIGSFDPHLLVLLAYALAVADYFPEELVREIFNINFLGKLDAQLETLPYVLNMRIRRRLMELNRAICLECPEFQVPWFHQRYCQELQKNGSGSVSPVQQQIHKMLGEVLGDINCVRVAVLTPYSYTVDFECVLDRHHHPVAYSEPSMLQISGSGKLHWGANSPQEIMNELPPGAQRIAVEFLDSKLFCKNSHHIKGEPLMKKRHLEILGYHVVQIPHFEWNSMELSTQDAWKEYLKKKIFTQLSS